jgi:hypothetical protein
MGELSTVRSGPHRSVKILKYGIVHGLIRDSADAALRSHLPGEAQELSNLLCPLDDIEKNPDAASLNSGHYEGNITSPTSRSPVVLSESGMERSENYAYLGS